MFGFLFFFFFSSRRRHTRSLRDWSSDVVLFRSLSALHAAIRSVAVRSNDANAERRAGRTEIAFRTRGAGRPRITLGPLTLTATQHCAGQRHRNEHSQHIHGLLSEEGATGCPISCSRKRPTERASRQNAVGDSGAVSYK